MLLDEVYRNKETGTTDTGEYIQFFLSGVTHGSRQETLKDLFENGVSEDKKLVLIQPKDQSAPIEVFLETPGILLSGRRSLGLVPKKICPNVLLGMNSGWLTKGEIHQVYDEMYGKRGLHSVEIRVYYDPPRPDLVGGKRFVLTGRFEEGTRDSVAERIENAGGVVDNNVTKKLDFLVIGNKKSALYGRGDKGGKQVKVERYIDAGCEINILTEEALDRLIRGIAPDPVARREENPDNGEGVSPEVEADDSVEVDLSWLDPQTAYEVTF